MKNLIKTLILALLVCSAMSVPVGNPEQLMNEEQAEQMMMEPRSEELVQDKVRHSINIEHCSGYNAGSICKMFAIFKDYQGT